LLAELGGTRREPFDEARPAASMRLLENLATDFEHAEDVLLQAMEFARGIEHVYLRANRDPELRRMLNQLLFERIEVEIDSVIKAELAQPFADIKEGRIAEKVKTAIAAFQGALQAANPGHLFDGQGSNLIQMVGVAGFEPATSRVVPPSAEAVG
jgi:hypothetical protein